MSVALHPPAIESDQQPCLAYASRRARFWDTIALTTTLTSRWNSYYHGRLADLYRFHVPPNSRILEVGCGFGDLLAGLRPSEGVGVDFSGEMLSIARRRHPELTFVQSDAHDMTDVGGRFDYIILSDLVNDLWDVLTVLEGLSRLAHSRTRLILNFSSRLWEKPLRAAARLRMVCGTLEQNWFTVEDISNLLDLAGYEVVSRRDEILLPLPIPGLAQLCNRYLVKLWPWQLLALTHLMVARLRPQEGTKERHHTVSVVVPARNEQGHIADIFRRTPEMGKGTELVFVEGGSHDGTWHAIQNQIALHPERRCQLWRQTGVGKGDAVRLGFEKATGNILMILDADLTVSPEALPQFYRSLTSGQAEFVNGVRLVYPMEQRAMRFFNLVGNKFFSLAFAWLLGKPIKDTLCGTKALFKHHYEKIARNREYFGDFDPFGDFDLLFGAAKLNLKIVDMPIRYGERTYGATNIRRWRHGLILLRMVVFAARRIKFI